MYRFHAEKFVDISNKLGKAYSFLLNLNDAEIEIDGKFQFAKMFDEMSSLCKSIGLGMSVKQAEKLSKMFRKSKINVQETSAALDELNSRIYDELSSYLVLVIRQANADYYEQVNLFGDEVFNNFASANFDIEEAGKCLATERHTACVMHLQRVLEVGLKAYGKLLAVTYLSPQPSWGEVLRLTGEEIRERNNRHSPKNWNSKEEKEFCEGIQPFLVAVKNAWRNTSMHADKVYNEEIAKEIFDAVRGFMRHLAEHLNEKGKFRKNRKK